MVPRSDQYILALDEGTTSARALLVDTQGRIVSLAQQEITQCYPNPAWVEEDPEEIWITQYSAAQQALESAGLQSGDLAAIGITNQRETTILWDRESGAAIYPAIVWQDRRTADLCEELKKRGLEPRIREKTGLCLDAYFSATKICWILDHLPEARRLANEGKIAFGTVDSWLIWKLTSGQSHVTDITNASRTLLFNIHDAQWDEELLEIFRVPRAILPDAVSSSGELNLRTNLPDLLGVPISGVAGDQQAALFGQRCFSPGDIKCTYGTGCFLLQNIGDKPISSSKGLLTTIAWQIGDKIEYAFEGSIFVGGAVVQWLRDGLGLIASAPEVERLAKTVHDNGGVYFVPAFVGLGAPHWDSQARGTLVGLTRGTKGGHIARAALEAITYQVYEIVNAMNSDARLSVAQLNADGGASTNDLLMQLQSDLLQVPVHCASSSESTALGAAFLAGIGVNFWKGQAGLPKISLGGRSFHPQPMSAEIVSQIANWNRALERAKGWNTEAKSG